MKPDTYTLFPNDILEALYKSDMSGSTFRVALLIYRYTYGFHRQSAKLTVSFISEGTGLNPRTVQRSLGWLSDHGYIVREGWSICQQGAVKLSAKGDNLTTQENKDKKENSRKKEEESNDDISEDNQSTHESTSNKHTGYRF